MERESGMNRLFKAHRGSYPRRAALAALACACAQAVAHAETDLTRLPLESLLEMRVIAASSYEQSTAEAMRDSRTSGSTGLVT